MTIERKVDEAFAKELFGDMVKQMPFYLKHGRTNPKSLSSLIGTARYVFSCGYVAEPQSPEVTNALEITADAHHALFAAASNPSGPVTVRLGAGEPVTYTSPPDESTVNVGAWITGFYFNVLCGNLGAIDALCKIPTDVVRRSTTKAADYHYLYMESLQAMGSNKLDGIIAKMLAAVKATDPNRTDILDPDWTLNLHVPQLEVLIYVVTKDAKFGDALTKAVQLHKKYWEKTKDRRRDYHGMVSVELTALAALGRDRGLSLDIESPYLAMDLVK